MLPTPNRHPRRYYGAFAGNIECYRPRAPPALLRLYPLKHHMLLRHDDGIGGCSTQRQWQYRLYLRIIILLFDNGPSIISRVKPRDTVSVLRLKLTARE